MTFSLREWLNYVTFRRANCSATIPSPRSGTMQGARSSKRIYEVHREGGRVSLVGRPNPPLFAVTAHVQAAICRRHQIPTELLRSFSEDAGVVLFAGAGLSRS